MPIIPSCDPCTEPQEVVVLDPCCSVTFTGFCLDDGTPIGIVVQEDEQIGWFNLTTAVFLPGAPPSGTGPCQECIALCPEQEPIPVIVTLDCATDSVAICGTPEGSTTPAPVLLTLAGSVEVALTERSSEVRGRLHVDKHVENVSAFPATIHTVTAGRIFYLMSIGVTGLNTSVAANGRLVIRDDTTVKIPYLVGQASSGAPGPIAIAPAAFLEPIPFATDVNIQQLGGTNTVSIYIVGYEE